jgi:hypothetical protein
MHVLLLPVVLQLAALRQQIAGLRAENLALRTALGGDREAAAALAAAGRAGQVRWCERACCRGAGSGS